MEDPRWWVVYGDRSIYAGAGAESAYNAPGRDVQVVISTSLEHGFEVWRPWKETSYFVYFPDSDRWRGVDLFGLWDYLCEPGPKKALFGRTMFDEEWQDLLAWVTDHPALPPKTGWRPGER